MNAIWEAVTWDIARAGGFTAYILLALAVIVGLALSTKLQSPSRWPRLINSELHNFLTLLGTIFLTVHVLAVWIDPFTHFGLNEILIPLASHYRPVWMAFGIVALYLGIAIGISTLLRPRIGYSWWRRLHVLTLGIFVLATVHGIATGSDTQTLWALGIYVVSSIVVGSLLIRRVLVQRADKRKAYARSGRRCCAPCECCSTKRPAREKRRSEDCSTEGESESSRCCSCGIKGSIGIDCLFPLFFLNDALDDLL